MKENVKLVGIANSFAAGLFLGVAFLDIMPEVIKSNQMIL